MKKTISVLLCLFLLISCLPFAAFADELIPVEINEDFKLRTENAADPDGAWTYTAGNPAILTLKQGYAFTFKTKQTCWVYNYGVIVDGEFGSAVKNYGTILGGKYTWQTDNCSGGVISGGDFSYYGYNHKDAVINGGSFHSVIISNLTGNSGTVANGANGVFLTATGLEVYGNAVLDVEKYNRDSAGVVFNAPNTMLIPEGAALTLDGKNNIAFSVQKYGGKQTLICNGALNVPEGVCFRVQTTGACELAGTINNSGSAEIYGSLKASGTVVNDGKLTFGSGAFVSGTGSIVNSGTLSGSAKTLTLIEKPKDASLALYYDASGTATAEAYASGAALSYAWYFKAAGAESYLPVADSLLKDVYSTDKNTLTLSSQPLAANGGSLRCVISNAAGSVNADEGFNCHFSASADAPEGASVLLYPANGWTQTVFGMGEKVNIKAEMGGWMLTGLSVYKTGDENTQVEIKNGAFTMPAFPVTVKAEFTRALGISLVTEGGYGTADVSGAYVQSVSGGYTAAEGSKVKINAAGTTESDRLDKLTVTKADNETVKVDVKDNGFIMPDFPVKVTACFSRSNYTVFFEGDADTVNFTQPKRSYAPGESVTVTLAAKDGYLLDEIYFYAFADAEHTAAGEELAYTETDDGFTFTMPAYDVCCEAYAVGKPHTVTLTVSDEDLGEAGYGTDGEWLPDTVRTGETVYIEGECEWGYTFGDITVTTASGEELEVGDDEGYPFFIMPDDDVQVFVPVVPEPAAVYIGSTYIEPGVYYINDPVTGGVTSEGADEDHYNAYLDGTELTFSGLRINDPEELFEDCAEVFISCYTPVTIRLAGENTVAYTCGSVDAYYGIYAEYCALSFAGSGALTLTASGMEYVYGVYADGKLSLQEEASLTVDISALAGGIGIYGCDGFEISGNAYLDVAAAPTDEDGECDAIDVFAEENGFVMNHHMILLPESGKIYTEDGGYTIIEDIGDGLFAAAKHVILSLPAEKTPAVKVSVDQYGRAAVSGTVKNTVYSFDGENWNKVTGDETEYISDVVPGSLYFKNAGDGEFTKDSGTVVIEITKAAKPEGVAAFDCTNGTDDNGEITGVDTSMEYMAFGCKSWTPVRETQIKGLIPGIYCVRVAAKGTCLASGEIQLEIKAHKHVPADAVEENRVNATCTDDGKYDSVVYCSLCEKEQNRETIIIPKLGHDYEASVTAPTCTKEGYTTYTCSRCKDTYKSDSVEKTAHQWDGGKVTKAATCKEEGVMTYTCSVCKGTKKESIPMLTTHTYDAGKITKAATCREAGVKTFTCTVCGATKPEPIAKLTAHTYENGKCTVCGAADPDYDPAPAFTYGDVDGNGKIEAADARLALRGSVGLTDAGIDFMKADSVNFLAADVDMNGKVEAADARLILRFSVGLENKLGK